MISITIMPGVDKNAINENFDFITLESGNIYTIIGNTGSGKSRLIKDIEQFVFNDSITKRKILFNNKRLNLEDRIAFSKQKIAHLSQNMKFNLDVSVKEFLELHLKVRSKTIELKDILNIANDITEEPIKLDDNLNLLSGGQTRALMIADIAKVCDSDIVLIDEIENAGIDKIKAFKYLLKENKLIIIVTHDSYTALLGKNRIIMKNGAIVKVIERNTYETMILNELETSYLEQLALQNKLRNGEIIDE